MPAKPNLEPILRKCAQRVALRAASQIEAGAPRVAHRAGAGGQGPPGGTLPTDIRRPEFIRSDGSKAVLQWHALGPQARWLKFGSVRQAPRPFDTLPTKQEIEQTVAEIKAEALRVYRRRLARAS